MIGIVRIEIPQTIIQINNPNPGRRELKIYVTAQPSHERAMCFIAGVVLMFHSVMYFFWLTMIFQHFPQYVLHLFMFCIGGVIAILNGVWALPTQEMLLRYCFMLHTKDGQALVFFFLGSIVLSVEDTYDTFDYIVFFWLWLTGIMCTVFYFRDRGGLNSRPLLQQPQQRDVNVQDVYGQM